MSCPNRTCASLALWGRVHYIARFALMCAGHVVAASGGPWDAQADFRWRPCECVGIAAAKRIWRWIWSVGADRRVDKSIASSCMSFSLYETSLATVCMFTQTFILTARADLWILV